MIEDSHPGLHLILDEGTFTIHCTEDPFSRCPVDPTLELTINADNCFTNNNAAQLSWMITKSTRATFISFLQEMAGLIQKEEHR